MNNFERPKSINDTYLFNKLYDNDIYTGALQTQLNYQLIPKLLNLNPDKIEMSAFSNPDAMPIYDKLNKIFRKSEIYKKLKPLDKSNLNLYQRFLKISESIYICTYFGFDVKNLDMDYAVHKQNAYKVQRYYYVIINLNEKCVIYSPNLIIDESYSFERPKSINDTIDYNILLNKINPYLHKFYIIDNFESNTDITNESRKINKYVISNFNNPADLYFKDDIDTIPNKKIQIKVKNFIKNVLPKKEPHYNLIGIYVYNSDQFGNKIQLIRYVINANSVKIAKTMLNNEYTKIYFDYMINYNINEHNINESDSFGFKKPTTINDVFNYPQAVKRFKNIMPMIKNITITQNRQDLIKLDKKISKHFNRIIFIHFTDSSIYDKLKLYVDDSFINLIKNDISQLNKKGEKVEYIDILYSKDFGRMIKLVVYHLITPISIGSSGEEGKFYLNLFYGDEPFNLNESYSFERPKSINDSIKTPKDIWEKFDIPKIYNFSTYNILYNDSSDILTYMIRSDIDAKLHYENGFNDRTLKGGGIYKKDIIIKDLSKINQKAKYYLDKYNCELYLIELKKPIPIKYFYIGIVIIKLSDNPNDEGEFNDNNYAFTIPIEADNVKLLYKPNLTESVEFKKPASINDTYLINKLKPLNEIVMLNDINEVNNIISYLDSNNFTNDYELFENTYMKGEIKKIFSPADFIDYIKRKYFLNSDHTTRYNIKKIAIRYSIEYDLCIVFFNDTLYDEVMYICFKTSEEIKKALDENVI